MAKVMSISSIFYKGHKESHPQKEKSAIMKAESDCSAWGVLSYVIEYFL